MTVSSHQAERLPKLAPPSRLSLIGESRVVLDAARMVGPLAKARLRRHAPEQRDRSLLITVPGFSSDDRYLAPLRYFLKQHGYRSEGWGLGRNLGGLDLPHELSDLSARWQFEPRDDYRREGGVPYLCDRLIERIEQRHRQTGERITLVGWSLGGYLSRECARELPEIVDQVVTFGSPTVGGPKYTAVASVFQKRGMDLDWIEREISKRDDRPIEQPLTAIYSKSDGIVSWTAALDRSSLNVEHVELDVAHLGMGFSPVVWAAVLSALQRQDLAAQSMVR